MADMKEYYFKEYNIDETKAVKRALVNSPNGIRTAMTEMLGETIIKKHHLWNVLFPNYQSVKKATSKKNQKEGTDYFITTEDDVLLSIDIKVCCGPSYSFNKEYCFNEPDKVRVTLPKENTIKKQAPIELMQKGIRTFTSRKKTDYLLFIFADAEGISYYLMEYDKVLDIVDKNISKLVKKDNVMVYDRKTGPYKHYISNNGTGEYISVPVDAVNLL